MQRVRNCCHIFDPRYEILVEETHIISRVSWKKMVHYVPQHVYFGSHVVSKAAMAARMISKLIHGRPVAKVSPLKLSCCIWAEPTPMAQKQRLHASQSTNQATTEPDTHMCIPQILRAQGFQKTCWYHGLFFIVTYTNIFVHGIPQHNI